MTDGVMETGGLSGVTTADRQPQAVPHTASAASVCVCVCVHMSLCIILQMYILYTYGQYKTHL